MLVGFMVIGSLLSIPVGGIVVALNLIPIIGSLLGGVVNAAVLSPLWYGVVVVAKTWPNCAAALGDSGDFFGGFRFWGPLFVYTLIVAVCSWLCTLPGNIFLFLAGGGPQLSALLQGVRPPPPDPMLNLLGQMLNFAGVVIVLIVSIRFFVLCPYLIISTATTATASTRSRPTRP